MIKEAIRKPVARGRIRQWIGPEAYRIARRISWMGWRCTRTRSGEPLPYLHFAHKTPLIRTLRGADMYLQINKITNLRIASQALDGILLRPGELFSFWRLVGKPSARKGYLPGIVLKNGACTPGVGGGLCQITNMLFWMALHTQLRVVERFRHSYDVFPDSNRTQPFGSGATCVYNYRDLILQNPASRTYQIRLWLDAEYLHGEIRADQPETARIWVEERDHRFEPCPWGGYLRINDIWRITEINGERYEQRMVHNEALTMYEPLLSEALPAEAPLHD